MHLGLLLRKQAKIWVVWPATAPAILYNGRFLFLSGANNTASDASPMLLQAAAQEPAGAVFTLPTRPWPGQDGEWWGGVWKAGPG